MKKACVNCPFRKGNEWIGGGFAKELAFREVARQKIFSCHMKHADRNVFSLKDMQHDDCLGFSQMKENIHVNETHPEIVNRFNETGPELVNITKFAISVTSDLQILRLI